MKSYTSLVLFVLLFTLLPSSSMMAAADDPITKTFCTTAFGYPDVNALKADLVTNAKREAVSELFGELLTAATTVEDFVVTSDQIRTSSIGFVRVEGNSSFYNGDNLAEVCVTIHAYATPEDREKFDPVQREKRHCVTDAKLTTSELTAFAKEEVIIQTLLDYDRKLEGKERSALLQLFQRVDYLESGFVAETETYCVRVSGYVVPIEVIAFLEADQLPSDPSTLPGTSKGDSESEPDSEVLLDPEAIYPQQVDCSSTIQFGQTMDCEIESAGQKNAYEFTAEADDQVSVTVVRTRGDISPAFTILDAAGNTVKDDDTWCQTSDSDIAEFVCRVPETGDYSIMVYSYNENKIGKYNLRLQRMNNPVGAVPLEFGQVVDGSLDAVSEYKYYTFAAEADDQVSVTVVRTRGDISPALIIRDAFGYGVKDDDTWCQTSDSDIAEFVCRVPETGDYSIMIYSYNENKIGKYNLRLQRMNNPVGAVPLEFGQVVDGSLDAVSEYKYYTFAAQADAAVRITVAKTRGDMSPAFVVRDASGYWVKDDGTWCQTSDSDIAEFVCNVPETGDYSIMVYSYNGNKTGKYTLTINNN